MLLRGRGPARGVGTWVAVAADGGRMRQGMDSNSTEFSVYAAHTLSIWQHIRHMQQMGESMESFLKQHHTT